MSGYRFSLLFSIRLVAAIACAVALKWSPSASGSGGPEPAGSVAVELFRERDGETLYSRSAAQSKAHGNVSVAIYVSGVAKNRAIEHAKKICNALKGVGISSQILVQIHEGSGVGFSYYVNGLGVFDESLGKNGVYGFRNSIRVLQKAVAMHRAQGEASNSVREKGVPASVFSGTR